MKNFAWKLSLLLLIASCDTDEPVFPMHDVETMPFEKLSDYGFFRGELKNLQPVDGIIPYDLNTPLFSDFAGKSRLVYIPKGEQAVYSENEAFDFPVGTVLIKTFYFSHDLRELDGARTLYEPRLIIHKSSGWEAAN